MKMWTKIKGVGGAGEQDVGGAGKQDVGGAVPVLSAGRIP